MQHIVATADMRIHKIPKFPWPPQWCITNPSSIYACMSIGDAEKSKVLCRQCAMPCPSMLGAKANRSAHTPLFTKMLVSREPIIKTVSTLITAQELF